MKKQAFELVEELNNRATTNIGYYCPFEFKSHGYQGSGIWFMGIVLWTDENDEREYLWDSDEKEDLETFIVRESKSILKDLRKKMKQV